MHSLIKPFLILGFLAFSISIGFSQERSIKARAAEFFEATQKKDWEKVLDLTYPRLFEIATRDQMMEAFNQMENSGIEIGFGEMEILKVSGVKTFEGVQYSQVDYHSEMSMKLVGEQFSVETMGFMKTGLEASFGEGKVEMDEKKKMFLINSDKSMYAIADEGSNNWYFLEQNAEQKVIMDMLIPGEVQEHFQDEKPD
jgi:hypothetical protein